MSHSDIPREIGEEALGPLEEVFAISKPYAAICLILGPLAMLFGIAIPVLYRLNPPRNANPSDFQTLLPISGIFVFGGLVILIVFLFYRRLRFEVYQDGVVRCRGGRRDVIRWRDVVTHQDTLNGINFTLEHGEKVFWPLGMTRASFTLRDLICSKLRPLLAPAAIKRFQAGEVIDLGALQVDREKIVYTIKTAIGPEHKEIAWPKVSGVRVLVIKGGRLLCFYGPGQVSPHIDIPYGPRLGVVNRFVLPDLIALARPDLQSNLV